MPVRNEHLINPATPTWVIIPTFVRGRSERLALFGINSHPRFSNFSLYSSGAASWFGGCDIPLRGAVTCSFHDDDRSKWSSSLTSLGYCAGFFHFMDGRFQQ